MLSKDDWFRCFNYLDRLFHSRLVDMGRSTPYLEVFAGIDHRTAKKIVSAWVDCDPHETLHNRIKKVMT